MTALFAYNMIHNGLAEQEKRSKESMESARKRQQGEGEGTRIEYLDTCGSATGNPHYEVTGITSDTSLDARMNILERFGSADDQDLVAEIRRLREENRQMRFFMSVRIDFGGEHTVLDFYEENKHKLQGE